MEKVAKKVSIVNLFLFLIMIIVNLLANILPINGFNTGELSDMYPNLFVPIGLTFSIWGIIYLLLLFFSFKSTMVSFYEQDEVKLNLKSQILFSFTCVFNSLWILSWHYKLVFISLVLMILLLISLILLFLELEKIDFKRLKDRLSFKIPISVYLGWISVATIANVTAFLVNIKWNGFGIPQEYWTILVILVGLMLGILMLLRHNNISYSLVIIWAYIGIIIKRISVEPIYKNIILTCIISIIILIGLMFFVLLNMYKKSKEK